MRSAKLLQSNKTTSYLLLTRYISCRYSIREKSYNKKLLKMIKPAQCYINATRHATSNSTKCKRGK